MAKSAALKKILNDTENHRMVIDLATKALSIQNRIVKKDKKKLESSEEERNRAIRLFRKKIRQIFNLNLERKGALNFELNIPGREEYWIIDSYKELNANKNNDDATDVIVSSILVAIMKGKSKCYQRQVLPPTFVRWEEAQKELDSLCKKYFDLSVTTKQSNFNTLYLYFQKIEKRKK